MFISKNSIRRIKVQGSVSDMAMKASGYYQEALDRTHVTNCMFEEHVLVHPAIEYHPELKAKAEAISTLLAELYQDIGQKI
jgi:hypothetical protein